MRKYLPLIIALSFALLVAYLFTNMAWNSVRNDSELQLYCAYRYDPYGTAALYELLKLRQPAVTLLTEPLLPDHARGVLLNIVATNDSPTLLNYSTSDNYNPELLEWIRSGNTLIEMTDQGDDLTDYLQLNVTSQPWGYNDKADSLDLDLSPWLTTMEKGDDPSELGQWLQQVPWKTSSADNGTGMDATLELLAPASFRLPAKAKDWTILVGNKDRAYVLEKKEGSGRIVIIGSVWPALNEGLQRGNNLDFLLSQIGNQPVILNQWALGIGDSENVLSVLRQVGLMPILIQLLLLLAVYAWSRRGYSELVRVTAQPGRSNIEQIAALGHLYETVLPAMALRERVVEEIRRRLSAALRCAPEQIARAAEKLRADMRQRVEELLVPAAAPITEKKSYSSGQLRQLGALLTRCSEITKEIERVRHSGRRTGQSR